MCVVESGANVSLSTEPRFYGERISLTFRSIATFLRPDGVIVGQGARPIVPIPMINRIASEDSVLHAVGKEDNDVELERIRMYGAFSAENSLQGFDWNEYYGCGFQAV